MNSGIATRRYARHGGVLLLVISMQCFADGKLDAFEESVAEQPRESRPRDNARSGGRDDKRHAETDRDNCNSDSPCEDDDLSTILFDIFADLAVDLITWSGQTSLDRISIPADRRAGTDAVSNVDWLVPRKPGEPLIPFLRFDFAYQVCSSDLTAQNYRLETGYGPVGVTLIETRYHEQSPGDDLRIRRFHLAYRMSFASNLEVDFGLGSATIHGNTTRSYGVFTVPILFRATDGLSIEYRPAWYENVSDHDIGLLFSASYYSVKLGYRALSTQTESLKGPYLGLAVHY